MIYHIVPEKEYLKLVTEEHYIPDNFNASGFIHCAFDVSVLTVADDYYLNYEDKLILLKINPEILKANVKNEEASPEQGSGTAHLDTSKIFPHIYGPVDNNAVEGIGELKKENGKYSWPDNFIPLSKYLQLNKSRKKTTKNEYGL